jgi:hypothetical protein
MKERKLMTNQRERKSLRKRKKNPKKTLKKILGSVDYSKNNKYIHIRN